MSLKKVFGVDTNSRIIQDSGAIKWISFKFQKLFESTKDYSGKHNTGRNFRNSRTILEERKALADLTKIINNQRDKKELIITLITYLKNWLKCDAIGIRLKEGIDYPYYESKGFSKDFLRLERFICSYNEDGTPELDFKHMPVLECRCGNVICGRFDTSTPFFTKHGSFYANNAAQLKTDKVEADRKSHSRHGCYNEGYQSVGLFPIRIDNNIFGLLQVNHLKTNFFNPERITFLEQFTNSIAIALLNIQTHESLSLKEEFIQHSKEEYIRLAEDMPGSLCSYSPNGRIIFINSHLANVLKSKPNELIGKSLFDLMSPGELEQVKKSISLITPENPYEIHESKYFKNEDTKYYLWTTRAFFNKEGHVINYQSIGIDITERKKAEIALIVSEEKYSKLFHENLDALAISELVYNQKGVPADFMIIEANSAFEKIIGLKREKVIDKMMSTLMPEKDLKKWLDFFSTVIENGGSYKYDNFSYGINKYIEGNAFSTGKNQFAVIFRDVTERKKIEQALKISEELFRETFNQAAVGMVICDTAGNLLKVNQKFSNILGYSLEEVMNKNFRQFTHPDSMSNDIERIRQMVCGIRSNDSWEKRYIRKDGTIIWGRVTAALIHDEQGNPIHFITVIEDITENKIAREKLEEFTKRLKLAADSAQLGIWDWNVKENIMIWDNRMFELYGIPFNNNINTVDLWTSSLHPDDKERAINECNIALIGDKDFNTTFRVVHANGKILYIKADGLVIRDNDGTPLRMIGINRDVTENKIAEEKLVQSEQKFAKAFMSTPEAFSIVSLSSGKFIEVNDTLIKITGFSREEVINHSDSEINFWVNKDDRLKYLNILFTSGTVKDFETEFRMKSGEIRKSLISGEIFNIGNDRCSLNLMQDITERKKAEAELIKAKEKAEESDRLKTAFLQNMSHEIRTPMNAIMGFSELIPRNFDNKQKLISYSETINQRCSDLLGIINDILDISKIESGQLILNIEPCDLNKLFDELTIIANEQKARCNKHDLVFSIKNLYTNELILNTDNLKLKQVFINLINNAIKFTNEGTIECGCFFNEDNNLIFFVSDTGIGIPKEKHDLIFDRFSQIETGDTRKYGGTGLGLSIVKGLLELLGGTIWLDSEPGKGTTFYFTIENKKTYYIKNSEPINYTRKISFNKNKKILVVEDDKCNITLIEEILNETELIAYYAVNGKDAIEKTFEIIPDLILMDIGLPDMSGYDAVKKILSKFPEMKIIAQTAYATNEDKKIAFSSGCIDHIAKPIKSEHLMWLLKNYL